MTINPKPEIRNSKQILNSNVSKNKKYDLEDRTFLFAKKVNAYVNGLPKSISNNENGKQLVRSAGSIGANYIEANESLGKKDFSMKIKICKKEAKESRYWLKLTAPTPDNEHVRLSLIEEATELMKIFGAILNKCHE